MKVIQLRNNSLALVKAGDGYELQCHDRDSKDVIAIVIPKEVWDNLVRQASGVVLPNGPVMAVPKAKPRR